MIAQGINNFKKVDFMALKANQSHNTLAILYPDVSAEWDYEKTNPCVLKRLRHTLGKTHGGFAATVIVGTQEFQTAHSKVMVALFVPAVTLLKGKQTSLPSTLMLRPNGIKKKTAH